MVNPLSSLGCQCFPIDSCSLSPTECLEVIGSRGNFASRRTILILSLMYKSHRVMDQIKVMKHGVQWDATSSSDRCPDAVVSTAHQSRQEGVTYQGHTSGDGDGIPVTIIPIMMMDEESRHAITGHPKDRQPRPVRGRPKGGQGAWAAPPTRVLWRCSTAFRRYSAKDFIERDGKLIEYLVTNLPVGFGPWWR